MCCLWWEDELHWYLRSKVKSNRGSAWGCVSLVSYLPIVAFTSIWFIAQVWWKYMYTHWQTSSLYYVYKGIQTLRLTYKYMYTLKDHVTIYHTENIVRGWLKTELEVSEDLQWAHITMTLTFNLLTRNSMLLGIFLSLFSIFGEVWSH